MPSVALITWFQYHNYGTALQVAALSHVLEGLGNSVDVVNYRTDGNLTTKPRQNVLGNLAGEAFKMARYVFRTFPFSPPERERLFDSFLQKHLSFTKRCETAVDLEGLNESYDAFVCGSDQIWAPTSFDSHYYLDFVCSDRLKVAYAPSVGLPEVRDRDVARRMGELAARIDCLSTREESGSRIIAELTNREVATVLDPTLLLSPEDWRGFASESSIDPKGRYLLVYMLGRNEYQWRQVSEIAEMLELETRIIPVFKSDAKRKGCISDPIGPSEFISLFANAAYVCTDSFHGVTFSILFERSFCVFRRFVDNDVANQNSRIYNLLEKAGLNDRLVGGKLSFGFTCQSIDWEDVGVRIALERESSLRWLEDALGSKTTSLNACGRHILDERSLCCGCSACSVVCPASAITVSNDDQGFQRAFVDETACIACGKCRQVCPFIETYGYQLLERGTLCSFKSNDAGILSSSSSGGAAAVITRRMSAEGNGVLGCVFDADGEQAQHRIVYPGDFDAARAFAGSKYLQSRMVPALAEAASYGGKLVVFGTPCQIAAARNVLNGDDRAVYIDLICHGVPSRHLYRRYLDWLHREFGMSDSGVRTEFRYKPRGWKQRYLYSTDGECEVCFSQRKDPFFMLYEAGQCYARCCYECPWRSTSAADLRLGDYWGPRFKRDKTGVSMVLALTDKGLDIMGLLDEEGDLQMQPWDDYARYQQVKNNPEPVFRDELIALLANPSTHIEEVAKTFAVPVVRESSILRAVSPLYRIAKQMILG